MLVRRQRAASFQPATTAACAAREPPPEEPPALSGSTHHSLAEVHASNLTVSTLISVIRERGAVIVRELLAAREAADLSKLIDHLWDEALTAREHDPHGWPRAPWPDDLFPGYSALSKHSV